MYTFCVHYFDELKVKIKYNIPYINKFIENYFTLALYTTLTQSIIHYFLVIFLIDRLNYIKIRPSISE